MTTHQVTVSVITLSGNIETAQLNAGTYSMYEVLEAIYGATNRAIPEQVKSKTGNKSNVFQVAGQRYDIGDSINLTESIQIQVTANTNGANTNGA